MSGEYIPEPTTEYTEHDCGCPETTEETWTPEGTWTPEESWHGAETQYVDSDHDGYTETTVVDSDGDGYYDTALVDSDFDGQADVAGFDNRPDEIFTPDVVAVDADGDGYADVIFDDLNFDGTFDSVIHDVHAPIENSNPYAYGYEGNAVHTDGNVYELSGAEDVRG